MIKIKTQDEILKQVDEIIARGPYSDDWASLCRHPVPKWYEDAKFGIFIHWGVYSVPAFGNEWYPRAMYQQGSKEYAHHLKTYGGHKNFGYKDFIPMFKAENFDAGGWIKLFKDAGAKYVMPVAEHHDGFQMYKSDLSEFNAYNMGPKRDVVGELKAAAEKEGIVFALSNHRAENCWFFNGGLEFDSDVRDPNCENYYGIQQAEIKLENTHDIYSAPPMKAHCENWLARVCEMVDLHRPRIVWFDWWVHNKGWKRYLKKFAAYYYNRAAEWGTDAAINYKYEAFAYGSAVFDVERGQLEEIRPRLWQTDTSIAKNSWGYTDNNDFKKPEALVCDLVDIVSKNGCMLLNVGPRADGTITEQETDALFQIGKWLAINGEGIYGSTFWQTYGEGPTKRGAGAFTDGDALPYTPQDIRFTYKNGAVYAFVMRWPNEGEVCIKSLASARAGSHGGDFDVTGVAALGCGMPVTFTRDGDGLHVRTEGIKSAGYPVCLKVVID